MPGQISIGGFSRFISQNPAPEVNLISTGRTLRFGRPAPAAPPARERFRSSLAEAGWAFDVRPSYGRDVSRSHREREQSFR